MERNQQRALRQRAHLRQRNDSKLARKVAPAALAISVIWALIVLGAVGGSKSPDASTASKSAPRHATKAAHRGKHSPAGPLAGVTGTTIKSFYKVKPADTFGGIAERTGVPVSRLSQLNPDVDPRALQPGQRLKLK